MARVKVCGPSATESSTPVTVTVCETLQFAAVNTRLAGDTTPSAGLLEDSGMVTSAAGCELSTTVKVTEVPDSEVEVPLGAPTMIPATSLSALETDTAPAAPLYAGAALVAVIWMVYATAPSTRKSFTPVTVTVWPTFQFVAVKVTLAG